MTVDFVPARPLWRSVPRKRLALPGVWLACAIATCASSACSDRADDADNARVALTTSAARELAQTQPNTPGALSQQNPIPLANAIAAPLDSPGNANSAAALAAIAVRSPARAPAPAEGASGADSISTNGADLAPLAPPEIHTAD
ncbi:hypothetical protein [Paraburkholderia sp. J67]|uniref:hypothetical protein n=1 Tax=Paraburkholderia sp. J67 TaxID=2805435 RepID=UPI002ABE9142|nr:hypothetical protein [Paraburkholderia sp. J67]